MQLMQLKDRENFLNNYLTPSIYAGWVEPSRGRKIGFHGRFFLLKKEMAKQP